MKSNNLSNPYARAYPQYGDAPKTVIAAVAYSLARRLCDDDHAAAVQMIRDEWRALHENQIVPQKPRR